MDIPAELIEELKKQGLVQGSAPPAQKQEASVEVKEELPGNIKAAFEKLAAEKAAFRAEQERLKPYVAALKNFDPGTLSAIVKAKESGDPMSLLTAAGFTHSDYADSVVKASRKQHGLEDDETPLPPKKQSNREPDPEIARELAELKSYVRQQQQRELMARLKARITPDKYSLTHGLGKFDDVFQKLLEINQRNPETLPQNEDEAYDFAAGLVEKELLELKNKFLGLTGAGNSADMNSTHKSASHLGDEKSGKTLTNHMTSHGAAPAIQTQEDAIRSLLSDPNFK